MRKDRNNSKTFTRLWRSVLLILTIISGFISGCKTPKPDDGKDNPLYGPKRMIKIIDK